MLFKHKNQYMKRTIFLFFCLINLTALFAQDTGVSISTIGADPDSSAILDVQSTDKGMLVPRMTTAQRTNINNAATGLLVFDTDTAGFWFYNSTEWQQVGADNLGDHTAIQNITLNEKYLSGDGDDEGLTIDSNGQVGIGQTMPQAVLDVMGHIRMEDGQQKAGHLMVSDSIGVASWKTMGSMFANSIPAADFSCIETQSSTGTPHRSEIGYHEGYAYVLNSSDDQVLIYDVSDPSLPLYVNAISHDNYIDIENFNAMQVHNGYLYIFTSNDSGRMNVYAWDLSDPANPVKTGGTTYIGDRYYSFHDFDALGNILFLVFENGSTHYYAARIHLNNPADPSVLNEWDLTAPWADNELSVAVNGSHGFACDDNGIVHAFPLSNPNQSIGTLDHGSLVTGKKALLSGNFLYISNNNGNEILVVDINDPLAMSFATPIAAPNEVSDMYIKGDYLYLVEATENNLRVIDIRSPQSPVQVGIIYLGAAASNGQLVVDGNYAYASVGNGWGGTLQVVKLSCNSAPGYNPLSGEMGPASAFTLEETLSIGNDANGLPIKNLADPTEAQDAATMAYVDASDDDHQSLEHVLLQGNSAGGMPIHSVADPNLPSDVATKRYVDISDNDNQTLANVLIQGNDAGNKRIHNLQEPWAGQDAATKAYVDNSERDHQTLEDVLTQGASAGGARITALANPAYPQDAATKSYVDNVTDDQHLYYSGSTISIDNGNSIDIGIYNANGNIGIGISNPNKAKLEINGWDHHPPGSVGFLRADGVTGVYNSSNPWGYSIYATDGITGHTFHAHSDARIKDIIGISDKSNDLETLLQIEVTDYRMRDTLLKGNQQTKKVIAQQVADVYPQAVSKNLTEVVPDIYRKANTVDGWILLSTDLQVGQRVKLITESSSDIHVVSAVEKDRFQVAGLSSSTSHLFVYGREVDDFHTVDYEAIAMLNVSATQELYHYIQHLEQKLGHMESLEQRISQLEALLSSSDPSSHPFTSSSK